MIKIEFMHIVKQCLLATIMITGIISCKDNTDKSKKEVPAEKPVIKNEEIIVENKADSINFKKSLSMQNIAFDISTTGKGSIQRLTIQPSGLKINNEKINVEVLGNVTSAEIGDLDSDGSPELLIYTTSAGSGSYGDVIGYSVNNGKSISQIYFPQISENKEISAGYMGHDQFAMVKNMLVQRFKIYNKDDSNSNPTGKVREIQYILKKGEAAKTFVVKNVTEYPEK